ncbi:M1 family metallopeptidase [Salisaeta longa]|uniref:M1 family metallopeptidase n=1 Tax=Salisaeta longa TaxID=503170 RepID=UPI001E2F6F3A|nr:M1 family metallopeptidase [Salisaeta longa]
MLSCWSALLLLVGGSAFSLSCQAQPAPLPPARPHPGMDVQHYDLSLVLSDSTDRIAGTATASVVVTADTLTRLRLDLVHPEDGSRTGMTATDVAVNGAAVPFVQRRHEVVARVGRGLQAGRTYALTVQYHGIPADGLIIGTNQHGARTFFGDNWPNRARHWLPVVDHPADKAAFTFHVTAPAHYDIVSNGDDVGRRVTGARRTVTWSTKEPLPTKVAVIGVADFAVDTVGTYRGRPVTSWVYPPDSTAGFQDLGQALPIVQFFAQQIAPYPYPKLANVQSTTRYGGMENAAAIFYSEAAVGDTQNDEALVAHEVAHQWFGNTVTEADWPHLWLSEGFATYLTQLYMEHAYGPARLETGMRQARERVIVFQRRNPNTPLVDTTYSDPNELLTLNPYQKGAWVLHMLRHRVGLSGFWDGLRLYYQRFEEGNATTADFRRAMEDATGANLQRFFAQWTRRAGHPVITGTWRYDAEAQEVVLTLRQTQAGAPFAFPLDVAMYAGSTGTTTTAMVDAATETVRLAARERPTRVVLDPNVRLLMEGGVRPAGGRE